jgi:hypothetical protein
VGSKLLRGVRFQSYSGDHAGAKVPHVHAHFAEGDVAIELDTESRSVGLSKQHGKGGAIDPDVKKRDVRRALNIASREFDALLKLWKDSRP